MAKNHESWDFMWSQYFTKIIFWVNNWIHWEKNACKSSGEHWRKI